MEKISVIVPVYNVEKYIAQCIESILCQTYQNIELILVNDGSQDDSGKICDEYAGKDSRIRVIHQVNRGLSVARNAGLDIASGDYIAFVDSDDFIKPNMYELLLSAMKKNNSDMVLCNYCKVSETGEFEHDNFYVRNETVSGMKALEWLEREHYWSYIVVWARLYKRSLFENLKFKENYIHEDEFIAHELYIRCKTVTGIEDSLYCYRNNSKSVTSVKGIRYLDGVEAAYERFLAFQRLELKHLLPGIVKNVKGEMNAIMYADNSLPEHKQRVRKTIGMYRYMVRELKWRAGVGSILLALFPHMYFKVKALLHK